MTTQTTSLSPARVSEKTEVDAIYHKINWRIVPIILFAYILAFLDRINVGFTQLQMKQDLSFSDGVFGLGAGLFFITYLMFEVPSNLLLEKIGARYTFLRIMVLWGLTSASMMFVSEAWHFYTLRLFLGVFEAGFFPGVILYLTYWYPSSRRARVTGLFLFGMPITGVIGGPITSIIMSGMNGYLGFKGWQWVFLIEGLPTVLVGYLLYKILPDKPRVAPWLSSHEKDVVETVLAVDREGETGGHHHGKLKAALADSKTCVRLLYHRGWRLHVDLLAADHDKGASRRLHRSGRLVRGAPFCLRCVGDPRNHQFVRSVARAALACCPTHDRRHTLLVCDDLFPVSC